MSCRLYFFFLPVYTWEFDALPGILPLQRYLAIVKIYSSSSGMTDSELIFYPGIAGLLIAVAARQYALFGSGSRSLASIVYRDPLFNQYATLSLLSILYSVYLGASTGVSVGLVLVFFKNDGQGETGSYVFYAFLLLISILIVRVSIENIVLLFKVGEKYLRDNR